MCGTCMNTRWHYDCACVGTLWIELFNSLTVKYYYRSVPPRNFIKCTHNQRKCYRHFWHSLHLTIVFSSVYLRHVGPTTLSVHISLWCGYGWSQNALMWPQTCFFLSIPKACRPNDPSVCISLWYGYGRSQKGFDVVINSNQATPSCYTFSSKLIWY